MKTPKFTDKTRFRFPYADAKASQEPGYLAARFQQIREQQQKDEVERKTKLREIKRK